MATRIGGARGRAARLLVLSSTALAGACTFTMYPGPKRPRNETALIDSSEMSVESIDGMELPVGSKFLVLPGVHSLSARSGPPSNRPTEAVTICFEVQAGRSYRVQPGAWDRRWRPGVIDAESDSQVRTRVVARNESCAEQPLLSVAPSRPPPGAAVAVARDPEPAPASAPAVSAAVDDDAPRPQVSRPAVGDNEAPRSYRPAAMRVRAPPPTWLRHPGSGLTFDMGAFFGGEDLVSATLSDGSTMTLSAGTGLGLSLGGIWTPLWIGDAAGFGVGANAGWKFDDISAQNASILLSRFPLTAAAHALIGMSDRWWFFLRGGVQKEYGISVSGTGAADQISGSLTGALGGFGEGGAYFVFRSGTDHNAQSFTLRYTAIHDTAGGVSIGASNIGFLYALYYNL